MRLRGRIDRPTARVGGRVRKVDIHAAIMWDSEGSITTWPGGANLLVPPDAWNFVDLRFVPIPDRPPPLPSKTYWPGSPTSNVNSSDPAMLFRSDYVTGNGWISSGPMCRRRLRVVLTGRNLPMSQSLHRRIDAVEKRIRGPSPGSDSSLIGAFLHLETDEELADLINGAGPSDESRSGGLEILG